GNVPRAKQVLLTGLERNGRQVKIRAWGLLARVFQHEVDHLEGKLFIDRTKDTHVLEEAGKSE
ncbi:MAG: peptide deformylase, partial [Patescibacteria group bacterium]